MKETTGVSGYPGLCNLGRPHESDVFLATMQLIV